MRAATMHRLMFCVAVCGVLPLAGCGNQSDLHAWVAKVKSRPGGKIAEVPQPKPYENFTYSASNLRSPFLPSAKPGTGVRPNLNRKKEYLEQFPLDALKLVGEININGQTYALVQDPQGLVHRVTKGDYLGQNNGRITAILPDKIRLTEIVPGGNGGWTKRPASLSMAQQSGG